MRIAAAGWGLVLLLCGMLPAAAQNPETLLPEQSTAKAKEILAKLIEGLGGPGYANVRESQCQGRRAVFGHDGGLTGYIEFDDFRRFPDKARIEYIGRGRNTILQALLGVDGLDFSRGGVVITLYNGDRGWTYDRSGIQELPAAVVSDFQEQMKRNIDNLLRFRLNEPGMSIRFGGSDTVDLRQVDWVELTDREERRFRLAIDRSTHWLVRAIVSTKDPEYPQFNDDTLIYTNYQLKDGVWTPLQVTRVHNGLRTAQFFYQSCRYHPGLSDDVFTRASLDKRYGDSGEKNKTK
ncbi:MAG TPA: hypothetical protein VEH49_01340 [Methylomirabilota bacterium]|nr:hypothetical protein [Methylomirabilota bacterium]